MAENVADGCNGWNVGDADKTRHQTTEVGHGESLTLRSPGKSCFGPSRSVNSNTQYPWALEGGSATRGRSVSPVVTTNRRRLSRFERVHDTIVHAVHAESPDNEKQPSLLFVRPLPRSSYPVKSCNTYLVSVSSSSPNMAARLATTLSCLRSRAALVLARRPSISSLIVLSRAASALALWICALLAQMLQIGSRCNVRAQPERACA
jgi:hypothetical protein